MHWLWHVLGIDTQQSQWYDFWSGFATKLPNPTEIIMAVVWYKHNLCHIERCPRLGKHKFNGSPYCWRHHPHNRGR